MPHVLAALQSYSNGNELWLWAFTACILLSAGHAGRLRLAAYGMGLLSEVQSSGDQDVGRVMPG